MGRSTNGAAAKDAQIKLSKEECAGGMGRITIQTLNLLHLDLSSNRKIQLDPNPINMLLNLSSWGEVEKPFQERCPSSVEKYTKFNMRVFRNSRNCQLLTKRRHSKAAKIWQ